MQKANDGLKTIAGQIKTINCHLNCQHGTRSHQKTGKNRN